MQTNLASKQFNTAFYKIISLILIFNTQFIFAQSSKTIADKSKTQNKTFVLLYNDSFILNEIRYPYESYNKQIRYKTLKFELTNKNGEIIYNFNKINIKNNFSDGLYPVSIKDKWGLLNFQLGTLVVPCNYDNISALNKNIISARKGGCYIYDISGKLLLDKPLQTPKILNNEFLYDKGAKNLTLYDLTGKVITVFNAKFVDEGKSYFLLNKNGKYGAADFNNKMLMPFEYDDVQIGYNMGYIILGKQTKEGLKYGMYEDVTLKKEIFPIKYDYLNETTIYDNDLQTNQAIFIIGDKFAKTLDVKDTTGKQMLRFNNNRRDIIDIQKVGDYYLLYDDNGEFQIFTPGSTPYCDEYPFTTYERLNKTKGLEDYIAFYYGESETYLLCEKHLSKKQFYFRHFISSFTYINKKCFVVNTDRGDAFFLPEKEKYYVYFKGHDAYFDNSSLDYSMVLIRDDYSSYMAYDLINDTLIGFENVKSNVFGWDYMHYLSNKINPYLKNCFNNNRFKDINISSQKDSSSLSNWKNTSDNAVLCTLPFIYKGYDFTNKYPILANGKSDTENPFLIYSINTTLFDYPFSISAVFDKNMNLVKPFSPGLANEIALYNNDTIIKYLFNEGEDSVNFYSVKHKKTIYNSQLIKMAGKTYFYPVLNAYGITNGEGKTGLVDYTGKLIIPFKYNEQFVDPSGTFVTFSGDKNLFYMLKSGIITKGYAYSDAIYLLKSECIAIPDDKNKMGIYDITNGKLLCSHVTDEFSYLPEQRYIQVGGYNKYGIFDLKNKSLVEEMKYSEEEIQNIFQDKNYIGVKID